MTACIVAVQLATLMPVAVMARSLPRSVLTIDESDPSSGAPTTLPTTLGETVNEVSPHVAIYGETLDLSRFTGSILPARDNIAVPA